MRAASICQCDKKPGTTSTDDVSELDVRVCTVQCKSNSRAWIISSRKENANWDARKDSSFRTLCRSERVCPKLLMQIKDRFPSINIPVATTVRDTSAIGDQIATRTSLVTKLLSIVGQPDKLVRVDASARPSSLHITSRVLL